MKLKSILFAACAASMMLASCTQTQEPQAPKYIFYFIGDGMGPGPATAAEMYNRQVLGNEDPITMFQFPVSGMALTYSASSPVTDSAAAGTALSTGNKTKNGMLGMDPDTTEVVSVAKRLADEGYGIGIATTVAPDDATPAAFYAHVTNRSQHYDIGVQAAESGYAFIAGAGWRGKVKDGQETDLLEVFKKNNVEIAYGLEELANTQGEKVVLLNYADSGQDDNNVGYTIDSLENTLTLPQITQACLDHLLKVSPDKFFMMIEGGNIDHALHANDGGAALKEVLNFNQAIAIAYEFYKQHPDETLIIVTADHDTAGMAIGNKFLGYNANFKMVDYQKVSKSKFDAYFRSVLQSRQVYTWDDMRQYLAENFGFWGPVPVNDKQTASLKEKFDATIKGRNLGDEKTLYGNFYAFTTEVFKVFNDHAGFGFVAGSHTGNPVPVCAVGVGAQEFANLNNNIDIPEKIYNIANPAK